MKRLRAALVCLCLLSLSPVWAKPDLAAEDARANKALLTQRKLFHQSSRTFEDWLFGRMEQEEALAQLRGLVEEHHRQALDLRPVKGDSNVRLLRSKATNTMIAGEEMLVRTCGLVTEEKLERERLQELATHFVTRGEEVWRSWLRTRQKLNSSLTRSEGGAFYRWEAGLLELQMAESELSEKLQLDLLNRKAGTGHLREALVLRGRSQALADSGKFRELSRAYLQQVTALVRLAEAVALGAEDRSPDSASRIRRRSREYGESSLEFHQLRQSALEKAVKP